MYVLGITASPRKNGNSEHMMSLFINEMEQRGAEAKVINAVKLNTTRCIGCGTCEKKGECVFKDDFTTVFLPEIKKADIIVIASPVYFYGFPADLKALIDRIQVLWSRKYRLKLNEFKGRKRKGVLLAVGATKGKDLFDGMKLTARYFFDAADISYDGELLIRGVDEKGELENHPTLKTDIVQLVDQLTA